MTKTNMDLSELLQKQGGGDFLRAVAEAVLQLIMGADQRTIWRNGYRERAFDTRLGTLNLKVPKLRRRSYFPGCLEPRKTSEKALVAVIQEAWIGGASTRRVDELVQAIGLQGISKSMVSKLCKDIDERVGEFLNRALSGEWPYVWLDATYLKVRQGGRIVSVAAIIAVAANTPLGTSLRDALPGSGRAPGNHRPGPRSLRGGNLLDGFPTRSESPRAGWPKLVISARIAASGRHRARLRGHLAALRCSLDAECAGPRLARPAHRRCRRDPPGLRPA